MASDPLAAAAAPATTSVRESTFVQLEKLFSVKMLRDRSVIGEFVQDCEMAKDPARRRISAKYAPLESEIFPTLLKFDAPLTIL